MRRTPVPALVATATSLAAALAFLAPAADAVSNGTPDDGRHPMVGLMAAHDGGGNALWRCSGTLVSATAFVTAGHCTSDDAGGSVARVELWFGEGPYDVDQGFLDDVGAGTDPSCVVDGTKKRHPGFPCTGERTGTAHTHPDYDPAAFWLRDLGVVVLGKPVVLKEYAELPAVGAFDGWRSKDQQSFTAVGYGAQTDFGEGAWWRGDAVNQRTVAHPELVSVNSPAVGDYALSLSGNARTGGTCAGDSGGPSFLQGTRQIAGVTSYGANGQTCSGSDGAYRLDRAEDVTFLSQFGLR